MPFPGKEDECLAGQHPAPAICPCRMGAVVAANIQPPSPWWINRQLSASVALPSRCLSLPLPQAKPIEEDQIRFFGEEMPAHTFQRPAHTLQRMITPHLAATLSIPRPSQPGEGGGARPALHGAETRPRSRGGVVGMGAVKTFVQRGGAKEEKERQVFFREGFIHVKEDRGTLLSRGGNAALDSRGGNAALDSADVSLLKH